MTASLQNYARSCFRSFKVQGCAKQFNPLISSSRTYLQFVYPTEISEEVRAVAKEVPDDFKDVYPDFIPPAKYEFRNYLKEKVEREDMLKRRMIVEIPEFYVGSVMRVSVSDKNATGKVNTFTGICTERDGFGMRSNFTLRNVIDHIGVEIKYDLYCPLILRIETLRLEKRLDPHLKYLRDCLPEYSTFPMEMEAEPIAEGVPVPVNETKAELKPRPWHIRWNIRELKGIQDRKMKLWEIVEYQRNLTPWVKYDLMLDYREGITIEEQAKLFKEIQPYFSKLESARRKIRRTRDEK